MSTHPVQPAEHKPALIVALACLVAFCPFILPFAGRLWAADHYSFFPLFLVAIAAIGYRRWTDDGPFRRGEYAIACLHWIAPAILLALAVWLRRPWIAAVGFVFACRAALYSLGGSKLLKSTGLLWWALWLVIPLPFNLDRALISKMQLFASQVASYVLDLFGYRHLLTGVLLNFPGRAFEVEEACSGVHSLFASLAGVAVYSAALRRGLVRTGVLLTAAVFWVFVLNIFRIILVVVCEIDLGIPLASGVIHEMTGYIIFGLVVLVVASTDRLLMFILPKKARIGHDNPKARSGLASLVTSRGQLSGSRYMTAGVAVFAVLFAFWLVRPAALAAPLRASGSRLDLTQSTLADEIAGWTLSGFEVIERDPGDINGEVSYKWTYERGGLKSVLAVDGPFGTWHDLGNCYSGVGWKVAKATDTRLDLPGEKVLGSELSLENTAGQYGHVIFCAFNEDGSLVPPPPVRIGATGGARLTGGVTSLLSPRNEIHSTNVFCIQALCQVPLGLSRREQEHHRELLTLAIAMLRGHLNQEVQP